MSAPVDLHTHTVVSDGTLTPTQLVELASRQGLCAIAITDHDHLGALPEAQAAGQRLGVEVVAGVELSVQEDGQDVHLLGYLVDPAHERLRAALEHFRTARATRGEHIVERLRALGIDITFDDVAKQIAQMDSSSIGRPHVARALVEKGAARDIADAFDRYLGEGRPAFVPKAKLSGEDAIQLVHEAGGVAVLAHPFTLPDELRDDVVRKLATAGLDGLEVEYPKHSKEERERYSALARELRLVETGGSDFHGENKPDIELGRGIDGNIRVGAETLLALKTRADQNRRARV